MYFVRTRVRRVYAVYATGRSERALRRCRRRRRGTRSAAASAPPLLSSCSAEKKTRPLPPLPLNQRAAKEITQKSSCSYVDIC